ncbi:MAG TPA: methionyl-tRNA formyltransferase [Solirubrobacterales bacterium]|nr:methionyl-tRNA formyltransferase [Solirubrobacterales bacterium]
MSARVAFFGTSDFAVAVLRRLADSEFRPALVVTPPDRRSGRGRRLRPPPAAEAARALGLELVQAESVNRPDAVAAIRAAEPEVAVVCAFGQLIREPLLGELEMLNVHPSLLPRWRGAAPIERAILAGDEETGVTVMRLGEGLDSGPIALQRRVAIGVTETCGALATRLAELGGELVVATLELRREGRLAFAEQDEAAATYAEKIPPEERRLDPRRPADELARRVRALTPHIGAYLELAGGGRLGVHAAEPVSSGPPAGELAAEGELVLGCGEGALRMLEVQPPGGRPMAADAYLRGHRVPALAEP